MICENDGILYTSIEITLTQLRSVTLIFEFVHAADILPYINAISIYFWIGLQILRFRV